MIKASLHDYIIKGDIGDMVDVFLEDLKNFNELQPAIEIRVKGADMIIPLQMPNEDSKEMLCQALRFIFTDLGVESYVYVSEAWAVTRPTNDKNIDEFNARKELLGGNHVEIKDLPDRKEIVLITYVTGTTAKLFHYELIRNEAGKAERLEKGEEFLANRITEPERCQGRFTNLIPVEKIHESETVH